MFNRLSDIVQGDPDLTPEQKAEAMAAINAELALIVQDLESARTREVELAKVTGGKHDYMMLATGFTGLLSFIAIVVAVLFMPAVQDNKLFMHLMGIVEGVVIGNIFSYYYGTSKSSQSKDKLINRMF
jgi:hypothetical protein